jgi:putative transcriptional regulator
MSNNPNRSRDGSAASNPAPFEIKLAREAAGLTQTQAARLIYSGLRTWQQWEAGTRRMHPAMIEIFRLKVGHITIAEILSNQKN